LLITSLHNPRVKAAARLRDSRQRARQGRFLIDGVRELEQALAAGAELVEVFACPALRGPAADELLGRIAATGVARLDVSEPVFAKLAVGVAVAPRRNLDGLRLPPNPLVGVLAGVEKPGNVGAVFRSADAAGLDALILADPGTDLWNPNCIRASLGTVFAVASAVAPGEELLPWLVRHGLQIVAARVDAVEVHTDIDFRRPTAIVLGGEAAGLSAAWRVAPVLGARLPMQGVADSLNVSAAAAVLFYEARRQRGAPEKAEKPAKTGGLSA
jgi:TrmH family RNA methyltransferase